MAPPNERSRRTVLSKNSVTLSNNIIWKVLSSGNVVTSESRGGTLATAGLRDTDSHL